MAFVLIDYKGGAAFRGCAALPHVVGWVTDLDAHLTRRALTSLTAEVRRRERLLAAAGVSDLDTYQERRDAASASSIPPVLPPLPRLVIVVDEFRVLAEELPDFVHGMVRLAAVGRSLGLHLVLATQRPAGVVTADMRANLSLRVALRVRDRMDSVDVIESPAAADIEAATPGRALLRGAESRLTLLQTALVTGRRRPSRPIRLTDVTRWWAPQPLTGLTDGPPSASALPSTLLQGCGEGVGGLSEEVSDLEVIVEETRRAAAELAVDPVRPPWLPPLPDTLDLASLPPPTRADDVLALGLEDRPDEQRQTPWGWPLDGHLGIAGGPGSGRTTALLTLAAALVTERPPRDCHLYAIGGEALMPLVPLPHTAAVASLHDPEHVGLVVDHLVSLVRARAVAARTTDAPLVVVLVDGWEQLLAVGTATSAAALRSVLDAAPSVGVLVAVTGGRAVLSGALASSLRHRLALKLSDPVELALAGIPPKAAPVHQPPGRALDVASHLEVQLGLPGGSADSLDPDAWSALFSAVRDRHAGGGSGPSPIRALPQAVSRRELLRARPTSAEVPVRERVPTGRAGMPGGGSAHTAPRRPAEPEGGRLLLGVREGDLHPVGFQAGATPRGDRRVLVVGPPGSGRTTALATLVLALGDQGRHVAVIGPELVRAVGAAPLRLLLPGVEMSDRLRSGPGGGTDPEAEDDLERLVAARHAHPDLAVVVDDVERLPGLGPVLREIARLVDEDGGFVAAATIPTVLERHESPLVEDLARAETGLHLHPRPGARLLGTTVGPSAAPSAPPPGRGLLVRGRTAERVQVAMPQGVGRP